jgi:flagellar biosynthesis protein
MYNYSNFLKGQRAVALGYDKKNDPAPKVIATGKGELAEQIINIARDNNIPIHQNADLVQVLSVLSVNQFIPIEVYGAVAEILSYIYKKNEQIKQAKEKKLQK